MNQLRHQSRPQESARHVVLVIDDDYALRNSLKFTLEVEGFEVRAYADAQELLDEASLLPRSGCLVTDYYMPSMNGLELVAKLRDRHVSMPAILITTLPSQNVRSSAAAAGIRIVEKPMLGSGLLDAICEAFDGQASPLS